MLLVDKCAITGCCNYAVEPSCQTCHERGIGDAVANMVLRNAKRGKFGRSETRIGISVRVSLLVDIQKEGQRPISFICVES